MRGDINGRLTILSKAEKIALYDIPEFDDFQLERSDTVCHTRFARFLPLFLASCPLCQETYVSRRPLKIDFV